MGRPPNPDYDSDRLWRDGQWRGQLDRPSVRGDGRREPNDAPTLDGIPNEDPILEDAAAQTITLTGISAGGGETQSLTVTATSDNPGLIPDPIVTYTSPDGTGSPSYTPVANQHGTAIITVKVKDSGGTEFGRCERGDADVHREHQLGPGCPGRRHRSADDARSCCRSTEAHGGAGRHSCIRPAK